MPPPNSRSSAGVATETMVEGSRSPAPTALATGWPAAGSRLRSASAAGRAQEWCSQRNCRRPVRQRSAAHFTGLVSAVVSTGRWVRFVAIPTVSGLRRGVGQGRLEHMFGGSGSSGGAAAVRAPGPLTTADLATFTAGLAAWPVAGTEAENVDRLRLLEDLKAVCGAVQARETVAFDAARRDAEAARGVPAAKRGRGVAAEVGLARRESPWYGARWLGFAHALVNDLPHTRAALERGVLSEWRAMTMMRETRDLPPEGRHRVDELM